MKENNVNVTMLNKQADNLSTNLNAIGNSIKALLIKLSKTNDEFKALAADIDEDLESQFK